MDYQRWLEEKEYQCQQEKERYERKQAKSHWNCPFFRHCWNEGLKLPTRHNDPKCSNQFLEFRYSQANLQSIHEHLSYQSNDMDQRVKNERVHDRLGKRVHDQNWADRDDERVCLARRPWCLGGLIRSQKRRVQRLRNRELEA